MKSILIITSNYWPEPSGIGVYTTDFADYLISKHYKVTVLTGLPHYPWWKIPVQFSQIRCGMSRHNGVQVFRTNHLIPKKVNGFTRIWYECSLLYNLSRASKILKNQKFDVVISYIPTVAAGIVAAKFAKKRKIPFGLIVQDLSGVGAKQSGLLFGAFFSMVGKIIERIIMQSADRLVVISQAMQEVVSGLGIPHKSISLIHNYSARKIESQKGPSVRTRFGWNFGDFVVLHTGNIGAKQGLENLIETSKLLTCYTSIKIVIVGHGNREKDIVEKAAGLSNVQIFPFVPDEDYPLLLSAADLLLVNERPTQINMSLPSKLTSYFFSNRPVIAAVPRGGATWKFIDGVAEMVEAGHPLKLADSIHRLWQNPIRRYELAKLGIEFAKKTLDSEKGRSKYLEWVNEMIEY